ncbi:MAG: MerR family transcriptional regulator [Chromatiaceae bacterium]|nr:MerR family transcriptional regulator [Chromatiaceae bacterium]
MNDPGARQTDPTYRIGAVSRLTGIAPDTLRVWERRYGVGWTSAGSPKHLSNAESTNRRRCRGCTP